MNVPRTAIWTAACVMAMALATPSADAKGERERYVFQVNKIVLKSEVPKTAEPAVKRGMAMGIKQSPRLIAELEADAPDPKKDPKQYKRYLKAKHLRAFNVTVEITEYEQTVEDPPEGRRGKTLVSRISLRMFGETVPERVMAFTGDGSATVKLGVGNKIRTRDREVADQDSIELAINDALATSIKKLDAGPETKKKKKKR